MTPEQLAQAEIDGLRAHVRALQERNAMLEADAKRLDWLLLDTQPDGIGDVEIWDSIPFCADETDPMPEYLKAARAAIDAAMEPKP